MRFITQTDVCHVLDTAAKRSPSEDHLVSLLMRSLIALCKTLGISRRTLVRSIDSRWDETMPVEMHKLAPPENAIPRAPVN